MSYFPHFPTATYFKGADQRLWPKLNESRVFCVLNKPAKAVFELTCPFWTQMEQLTSSNDLFWNLEGKKKEGEIF